MVIKLPRLVGDNTGCKHLTCFITSSIGQAMYDCANCILYQQEALQVYLWSEWKIYSISLGRQFTKFCRSIISSPSLVWAHVRNFLFFGEPNQTIIVLSVRVSFHFNPASVIASISKFHWCASYNLTCLSIIMFTARACVTFTQLDQYDQCY